MRLLAVAKRDGDSDEGDLTLVCILCIRDNVRKEAVTAIKEVQNAGIQVVMVTGDRKETAVAIAKEAGLIKNSSDVALTSAELNEKSDEELKKISCIDISRYIGVWSCRMRKHRYRFQGLF